MDDKSESGGGKRPPFNMVHRDLDRALAMCGLEGLEAKIMLAARELSYGLAQQQGKTADPLPFRLNIKAIARSMGGTPPRLRDARQRLIDDGVLAETSGGLIINKRYDQWRGAHALTPEQAQTARDAKRRDALQQFGEGGAPAHPQEEPGRGAHAHPLTTVKGGAPAHPPEQTHGVRRRTPRGCAGAPPEAPPLINSPVLGETETGACSTRAHTGAHGGAGGRAGTPVGERPRESDHPNGPSPMDLRKPVVDLIERQTAGALGYWAIGACAEYPARWVELLARRKILGAKPLPRIELLNSMLQRWAAAGECEYEPAASAEPKPSRKPGRSAEDAEAYRAKLYSDLEGL